MLLTPGTDLGVVHTYSDRPRVARSPRWSREFVGARQEQISVG